jgi:pimeloyl-ACP methyl ester carboxylesterase
MTKRFIRHIVAALLAVVVAAGASGETPKGGKLTPCHVPDVGEEVRCGRYEVYENRAAHTGREIALNIVVLPATSSPVKRDPLVFLAGGGVAPATRYAGFLAASYPKLREHRDILLIDQRGTGESNPLACELSMDPASGEFREDRRFIAAVQRCREEVEKKAELRYYTTPIAMDDLDEVRHWLGYTQLNLFGVSYGTTAAMVYVRQHPDRVRTAAIQGVIPIDQPMWLQVPRSAQQALERVFASCAAQPDCHLAFPDFENEFSALLKRFSETPVSVTVGRDAVTIDAEIFRGFVTRRLYSAERLHDLPLLIHLAYERRYEPLAERIIVKGDSGIPKGIYLSIVCSELVPQFNAGDLPAAAAGTFLGSYRVGRDVTACGEWVRGWLPENFWKPVRSNTPILVMNGELDHLTPPSYGKRVARSLPHSRQLILPRRGHNDTDACVNGIIEAFMLKGDLKGLDTSCLAKTPELTFALKPDELMP